MVGDPGKIYEALAEARRDLAQGRLTAADYRLQGVLESVGAHPEAMRMLMALADHLGVDYRNQNLALHGPTPDPANPRFLLIKSWGFGFWSDMTHVLGCLLLAEITGRVPVVHWGKTSRFSDGQGDAFSHYWRPVSQYSVEDVAKVADQGLFPQKWVGRDLHEEDAEKFVPGPRLGGINFLNRPERVVVSDFYTGVVDLMSWIPRAHPLFGRPLEQLFKHLVDRYLRPSQAVEDRVEAFAEQHFAGRNMMAVHIRGSDKVVEDAGLPTVNRQYLQVMEQQPASTYFFVMSDDQRLVDWLKSSPLGERIVCTESFRSGGSLGPHYHAEADPIALGMEVMTDAFLATRCRSFLGYGWSNVSAMITMLKPWPPGSVRLFGPSILHGRHLPLFAG